MHPLPPLSRLYRESFDDVWGILRRLGVPDASLEDAVHDVFVVVHRRRADFEGHCAVRTWLYGIARRVASRHRRTEARTRRRHQALAAATSVAPAITDADEQLARREAWLALQRFLAQLDRPQREAFVLGELQRLNRRELGVALGVSPNTAYSRLRAARARFSETFASGRPPSHTVLAAGRRRQAPSPQARQRVWLALSGGLGSATGATGTAAATAVGIKAALTTLGLAGAVLGMVAAVAPGPVERPSSGPPPRPIPVTSPALDEPPRLPALHEPVAAPPPLPEPPPSTEPSRRRVAERPRPSTASADPLPVEAALLRTAHAALARADAAAALETLHEHRRRFPRGVLAEERDASILRAQCALGHHAQARRDARQFVAAHPRSAYLEALADSCVSTVINSAAAGDPRE